MFLSRKFRITGLAMAVMMAGSIMTGCTSQTQELPVVNGETGQIDVSEETTGMTAEAVEESEDTEGTVTFYLVRHGKTIMNTLDLVQGWSDSPLTEAGVEVAKDAAAGLADIRFDYAYASDRRRAIETAEIILAGNNDSSELKLHTLAGLRETNFGGFEGEPNAYMWSKIAEFHGVNDIYEVMDKVGSQNVFADVPDLDPTRTAENHDEVVSRLVAAFDTIAGEVSSNGGGNVLVVGHGASLLTSIGALTGAADLPSGLSNASVSKVIYEDGVYQLEFADNMEFAENGAAIRAERELPVTIYLVRHGKTEFNTVGRMQGWIDSPLTEAGREVAVNLGKGLSEVPFDAVCTSGLGRTVETAELILAENETSSELEIQNNPGLRETNYGSHEGKMNADVIAGILAYFEVESMEELATGEQSALERQLVYTSQTDTTGDAENIYQLMARVSRSFEDVVTETSEHGGGNLLIVAHGNSIMAILESLGVKDAGDIKNASVTKIVYQKGEYSVEAINDMSYAEIGDKH